MKFIALPCDNCAREIESFKISLEAIDTMTLRLQCHACRTTTYYHLPFETLNCIARGEPVEMIPTDPTLVM